MLRIYNIKDHRDMWIRWDDDIFDAATYHFEHLFNLPHSFTDTTITNCIPNIINEEDNAYLTSMPNMEEIKNVVFSMTATSSAGPDGYNGIFYHKCWNIIANDIKDFVQNIFNGKKLTKFFAHTCLVLILKIYSPVDFYDLRLISLSNFSGKIIFKNISINIEFFA